MTTAFEMDFGASVAGDATRFRLWAPTARTVALVIEGHPELVCDRDADGWIDVTVPNVGAGARYRYRIDGETLVPDPASRYQPDDVNGPSVVVDPGAYRWRRADWRGRSWHDAVVYEAQCGDGHASRNVREPDRAPR